MSRRPSWGTLAERKAATEADAAERAQASTSRGHSTAPAGYALPRHVMVCATGRWHEARVGIFLEWRRNREGRWEALVIEAAGGGMTKPFAHLHWVDAGHVRPLSET